MVDCAAFFSEYSDFRDGHLEAGRRREMETHLEHCPACARYHRVVEGGVAVVQALPRVEASADFMARLEARLRMEEAARIVDRSGSGAPLAITVAIAATLAAIAWTPLARPRTPVLALPPVAAHAPYRVEAVHDLFRPGPLLVRERPMIGTGEAVPTLLFEYSPLSAGVHIVPAVHAH